MTEPATHDDLARLEAKIEANTQLVVNNPGHADLKDRLDKLEKALDGLSRSIESLVKTWETASGIVKFIKWLGGLAMACTAIWALIRLATGRHL